MDISVPLVFAFSALGSLTGGGYFVYLGLRGLGGRRPFLVPARQQMWFLLCCIAPQLVSVVNLFRDVSAETGGWGLLALAGLNIAVFVLLIVVFLGQFNGFSAYGVSGPSLRAALIDTLERQGIAFEERLSVFHLPQQRLDLQVALAEWAGNAQIRMHGARDRRLLDAIAAGVTAYYAARADDVRISGFFVNLLAGLFLVIVGAGSAWFAVLLLQPPPF